MRAVVDFPIVMLLVTDRLAFSSASTVLVGFYSNLDMLRPLRIDLKRLLVFLGVQAEEALGNRIAQPDTQDSRAILNVNNQLWGGSQVRKREAGVLP